MAVASQYEQNMSKHNAVREVCSQALHLRTL
jgi:hypothetical protein